MSWFRSARRMETNGSEIFAEIILMDFIRKGLPSSKKDKSKQA